MDHTEVISQLKKINLKLSYMLTHTIKDQIFKEIQHILSNLHQMEEHIETILHLMEDPDVYIDFSS